MMYELPPQASGTAEQQLTALRDYLVRLARDLDRVGENGVAETRIVSKAASKAQQDAQQAILQQAQTLKAMIIKNANEIIEQTDTKITDLHSTYVAISDYGNYYEQISTQVQQTARETVESYHYAEDIEAANASIGDLQSFQTQLEGQIRHGVLVDPDTNLPHLGIAISESLSFTGQTTTEDGVTYYYLTPGQSLGLYTSVGWEFWINGRRTGWFDSESGSLHVIDIVVEDSLQIGGAWVISSSGGFGLRYIGD